MKPFFMLVTLLLHSTGLWSHVPVQAKSRLTSFTESSGTLSASATLSLQNSLNQFVPVPEKTGLSAPPALSAASAYAIDTASGTVLYSKNPDIERPIASVTKLVTIITILSRHNPSEKMKLPTLPVYDPADELIGLKAGETYSVGDLIHAALIQSANDAADALALADSGTKARFAALMNKKIQEWGITGAHFSNPTGLVDAGNHASAAAMAKIAALAIANPYIKQTVAQTEGSITSAAGRTTNFQTTNDLLASGQFYGIKTGYTPAAGECFVGLSRVSGHEVITVVLGSDNRFGDTLALSSWIGQNWQWH